MKYNDETSMEPRLQSEIQDCLLAATFGDRCAKARLGGIATALHALTGTQWNITLLASGYAFINDTETECICAEL